MALEFRLLGPLEVRADGRVSIEGRRQQIVLAMLLLEPGRVMTVDRLIDALYGEEPPRTAATQVHICVSQLRRRLGGHSDTDVILTHPAGYLIDIPADALDLVRFRRHLARAREAARLEQMPAAVAEFRSGLALWHGDAVAGIASWPVRAAALRLNEERLTALQECIDLELDLRRHHELIGELTELTGAHPLRERLHAQLALALYRADRQVEALEVLRGIQRTLLEEHGLSPREELRQLERAILDNNPVLDVPTRESVPVVPYQLPAATPDFVGREAMVELVQEYLIAPDRASNGNVVVLSGPGGVGKSTFALYAAHAVRNRYPDGQLYLHLRDNDGRPMRPEQVLDRFLRALGVAPAALPTELTELSAMFRSITVQRRLLVVLDDASSADQVLPVVPAARTCALLVTSRGALVGLHGALRVELDVFDPATSLALLTEVIGEARVRTQEQAARELVASCGHLPLALRIVAAKLAVRRHWQIAQMVNRLANERRRLDELTLNGAGVRGTISLSYRELDARAARLLLLLGMLDNTDFPGWVAGPLLDVEQDTAADVLDTLVEARLVDVTVTDNVRYRLHELTRTYARELLATEIPPPEQNEAMRRLLRCWLFLCREAHRREYGGDYTILHSDVQLWPLPEESLDRLLVDPLAWLQTEYANLVFAVRQAARLSYHEPCWDLAVTLVTLFEARSYHDAWRETHDAAWRAVRGSGDRRGEAVLRYSRGSLALVEQRLAEAQRELEASLAWFDQAGEVHGRGLALRHLASVNHLRGEHSEARSMYERALHDLRAEGDRVAEAQVLRCLAQVHLDLGHVHEAERLLRDSLAICRQVGVRRAEAQALYRLGETLLTRDQPADAGEAFQGALRIAIRTNDLVGKAYALLGVGRTRLLAGDLPAAASTLDEAWLAARQGRGRLCEAQALLALAQVAIAAGDSPAAAARLGEAETIFAEIGAEVWLARAKDVRSGFRADT